MNIYIHCNVYSNPKITLLQWNQTLIIESHFSCIEKTKETVIIDEAKNWHRTPLRYSRRSVSYGCLKHDLQEPLNRLENIVGHPRLLLISERVLM